MSFSTISYSNNSKPQKLNFEPLMWLTMNQISEPINNDAFKSQNVGQSAKKARARPAPISNLKFRVISHSPAGSIIQSMMQTVHLTHPSNRCKSMGCEE